MMAMMAMMHIQMMKGFLLPSQPLGDLDSGPLMVPVIPVLSLAMLGNVESRTVDKLEMVIRPLNLDHCYPAPLYIHLQTI